MKQINLILVALLLTCMAHANNVVTANISIGGQNTSSHYSLIKYDISWDNSWRTSNNESNYDGCWIFVKFRKKNTSAWQHATINYASPGTAAACGHTQPSGSLIQTSSDGKGVWMYRSANGNGTVNWMNAQLRWNYGVDGVADNDSVEIKLFAVEMVYVTQGAFALGSNGSEYYHFRRADKDTMFNVGSENAITVGGSSPSNLSSASGVYLTSGTIPATYPKGYNAFWCMKYEISQQQYADFLNTIDSATVALRRPSGFATGSHPAYVAQNPTQAMNYLGIDDVLALLDWSALRPMTEFEYEKACRGANQVPIPNEYAWGNTTFSGVATPTDLGLSTETWGSGNVANGITTPIRCGALATATSTRTSSGGTYYGIMEMSGNVWEVTVTAETGGRTFINAHGDGNLDASAQSFNVPSWGGANSSFYAYRGGDISTSYLQVSDRLYSVTNGSYRYSNSGGRGVRTAQ